jgi:hypothetical protein
MKRERSTGATCSSGQSGDRVRASLCFAVAVLAAGCVAHHRSPAVPDIGISPCPPGAADRLLSTDALQCWFDTPHGRWRTLSHESHFAVLVVNIEAADLTDAEVIARRFVAGERETFSEILIYVQREPSREIEAIRRVRWTTERGFETLDFTAR